MSRALHNIQDFFNIKDNYPIFDLSGTKDETEHPEKFVFPYDEFFILNSDENTNYGVLVKNDPSVVSSLLKSPLTPKENVDYMLNNKLYASYSFKACRSIHAPNKKGSVLIYSGILAQYDQYITDLKFEYSTFMSGFNQIQARLEIAAVTSLIGDLFVKFNSPRLRRIEETPKRIKDSISKASSYGERPIIRLIDLDKIRTDYEKFTGDKGRATPPHPRRKHQRTLNSDWFVNKKGQTIEVKGSNVNGWEWKNSKGVTYKIV